MFSKLGKRRGSKPQLAPTTPPAPPLPSVWDEEATYFVCHQWKWVFQALAKPSMKAVERPTDLPSHAFPVPGTPATRRRRNLAKEDPSTFLLETKDSCFHGTSSALENLEDKDELVRTIQRCRCEHLGLSPPAVLLNYDVTHDECLNLIKTSLPTLGTSDFAVLKEPMGSQGQGIYFVKDAEEIHRIIHEHRQQSLQEPNYLESLIQMKQRIPSWVLQAEVYPSLLIRDHRKFHIRSYVVIIERPNQEHLLDIYVFDRHEVRIAGVPVDPGDQGRAAVSHITNGALSNTTERVLLHQVPELKKLDSNVNKFIAQTFGEHLFLQMKRAVLKNGLENQCLKFTVAGLDIMVTEEHRLYLLEVNRNPSAPKQETVTEPFQKHLVGFVRDLVNLAAGQHPVTFRNTRDLLR